MDLTAVKRHPMFEMEYYPNRGSWKLLDSDPTRPLVSNSFLPVTVRMVTAIKELP